jgi:hypothetical protein
VSLERLYTFREALEHIKFPSPDALRKYLARRPGLLPVRTQRAGRSTKRVLTEGDLGYLRDLLSRGNSPGLHPDYTRTQVPPA